MVLIVCLLHPAACARALILDPCFGAVSFFEASRRMFRTSVLVLAPSIQDSGLSSTSFFLVKGSCTDTRMSNNLYDGIKKSVPTILFLQAVQVQAALLPVQVVVSLF